MEQRIDRIVPTIIPLKRPGTTEDIAEMVAFLASDSSLYYGGNSHTKWWKI